MNSNRYSIVRFNPLFSACLIVVLLSLSSILLAQDPWTKLVDMPTARLAFGTAVVDGKIYVIGGAQNETVPLAVVEVYDPDTDSWDTNKTPMPKPKGGFGCAVVDGKIYVMGGGVVGIEKLSDVWMYDPATDTWDTTLTDMNVARFTLAADTVNGKIYAIGGADTVGVPILWGISTVEEYDPVADEWIFKTDKPTAGWGLRACTLGGKIYVTGGNIMWPDISAALEVYDPTTDSWDTTRTPMSEEKYSHSTIVINGKIYAFGGWDNSGYGPMYDDVDTYDPERDHWLERTAMPLELAEFGAAVVNNKAYIIGGTSTLHPFTSMNTVYKLRWTPLAGQETA